MGTGRVSSTLRFAPGYEAILKRSNLARSKRRPHLNRQVPPVGVSGFNADAQRRHLERLAFQTRNGNFPLAVLAEIRCDPQVRLGLKVAKAPLFTASTWVECVDAAEKALVEEVFVNRLLRGLMRTSLLSARSQLGAGGHLRFVA